MLRSTFRKLLAKEESNKPDVLTSIRYIVTLVAIFLLFLTSFGAVNALSFCRLGFGDLFTRTW